MWELAKDLAQTCRNLVPRGRYRWQLLAIVLVGAAIPLTELLITKIFSTVITDQDMSSLTDAAPQMAAFAALFLITRVAHYAQRTYRVTFFEGVFASSTRKFAANIESWRWAVGMELVNILTSFTQLVAMAALFTVLAPAFGLINGLFVLVLIDIVGRLFTRQRSEQRGYVERARAKERIASHVRVRSRIVSAEVGVLVSSVGTLLLLVGLLIMSIEGLISSANTIVLFIGLRMQNSYFSGLSGSIMRYARARANSY